MPEPLYYIPCPTCEHTSALLETTLSRIVRCLRKDFPQLEEGINVAFIATDIPASDVPRFRYLGSTRDFGGALQRDCHKEKDELGKKDLKSGFRRLRPLTEIF
jgi:hypothetical protein